MTVLHPSQGRDSAYLDWRTMRLARHPRAVAELVVAVGDIERLTDAEFRAMMDVIRRCNMAVYRETAPRAGRDDKKALRALGRRFGLDRLDCNSLADGDGITPLAVHREGTRARYIPYTDRPIAWHTDGYYNEAGRRVRGLLLHSSRPAAEGGENRLMDPEILYILLRDRDPRLAEALARPDAMTIPGNEEEGMARAATVGPVFFVEDGHLQMRYTARGRNIEWSPDPDVQAAVAAVRAILDGESPFVFRARLDAGMGLVCNNVLHTREKFTDDPARPRLLYRARYHDRIAES